VPPGSFGEDGRGQQRWEQTIPAFAIAVRCATLTNNIVMNYLDRTTINPNQCGGRPCIRGMRIRVKDVLEMLAARVPEAEILQDFPYLESADIDACLQYAAAQSDHAILVGAATTA